MRRSGACLALVLLAAVLSGCATRAAAPTTWGKVQGAEFRRGELVQSDFNRITQVTMEANLASLLLLADKLYRRTPAVWKKNAASREAALAALRHAIYERQPWAPLDGQRDIDALSLALSPAFAGDRVAAFIAACADTLITAHGGRREFYYLHGVDPQYIYNSARNMEIALWILNTRKGAGGAPLLLANEMQGEVRNLSFEREFGKIIGRLDLLASYLTERFRRTAINYVQSMAITPVLGFLPVR
ncbi:MAG: hypothetical protein IJR28_04960 [Ottowia sp.]|nr:hypothetical protein [Ottowia sp.]